MSSLSVLLSRREWVYLLSLLVPLFVYDLSLKASSVLLLPGERGFGLTLGLMLSDIFFSFGYVLLWIWLFAATRGRPLRRVVIVLFHAAAMLVVVVTTSAYLYFQQTGAALDYGAIAAEIPRLEAFVPSLAREAPPGARALLAAALLYAALGPPFLMRFADRWPGRPERSPSGRPGISSLGSLGLFVMALVLGSLSLLVDSSPTGASRSFARDPFVNVVLTGVQEATAEPAGVEKTTTEGATTGEVSEPDTGPTVRPPPTGAQLVPTSETQKRNVVLIHLESTRAQSTTPYNEDLKTTPFLDELSRSSLLAERAHVIVPRSSKGSTAINCGIEPALYPGPEFDPGGTPAPCLAGLLKGQGYRTVFFESLSNAANDYWDDDLVRNFGYDEFYSAESMNTAGYRLTNTFGYEDDIMLGPSEGWLRTNGYDKPFLAQYFTGTGHYGYDCVPNRYGYEHFSDNEDLDHYHNCLRYLDHFLQNLFDQYKRLGLYDNTIFVLYGDHGEGFKEHGRDMHGDTIWEEGLWVPLLIHAPGLIEGGERREGLSNQIDILPTVVEMLGYKVENGEYPGYSLLHPLPKDRTLMSSCISPDRCLASLKGNEKYIYHFGSQPDEVFDLSKDPLEGHNLASEYSQEEMDQRRDNLLAWRASVNAMYESISPQPQ